MYRKINIKQLISVFIILFIVVLLLEFGGNRSKNRTFKERLVNIEYENVSLLEVFPKVSGGERIRLFKENNKWMVENEHGKYLADGNIPGALIEELNRVKTESVVGKGKDKWERFDVTDSLGTRVRVYQNEKLLTDIVIGKFSFSKPQKMTSYVRIEGEKEIYGVDGMLGMSFNRNLNSFRNRSIINSDPNNWEKLTFEYPADSSFVLYNQDGIWKIEDQLADSAAVMNYINSIKNLSDSRFVEMSNNMEISHKLTIEGRNGGNRIEIFGEYIDNDNFYIESNQNKGNFFNSRELAEKIFIPLSEFLKD